jgi:transcriptional regulator with XRE-family HTH domain
MGWQELQQKWQERPEYAEALRRELPYREIADEVVAFRVSRGLTQRELADLAGTTQSVISRLESGRRSFEVALLTRVAEALGATWRPVFEPIEAEPATVLPNALSSRALAYRVGLKQAWDEGRIPFLVYRGGTTGAKYRQIAASDEREDRSEAQSA